MYGMNQTLEFTTKKKKKEETLCKLPVYLVGKWKISKISHTILQSNNLRFQSFFFFKSQITI